jgi:hypothetical protein
MSLLLAFALVGFVGGQEKKDQPKEPPKTQPKEAPKDGKLFAPKFEKDKKFYQESITELKQTVKVQGQDLTQKQDSTFYFEWTPIAQEGDKWKVKQKVEGLKMTIDISGNQISYDSTKGDTPTAGNPGLTEFFKKLSSAEFTATIDKSYKVEKVEGREEFIRSLSTGSPQVQGLLEKILTDDALKEMCDPSLKLVPQDGPKKAGDKWKREGTVNLGPIGSYTVTYNYTYVGPEKDMDKIEVETSVVYTAPKNEPGATGLLFRITKGTLTAKPAKGTILYDPKTGRVASAEITISLEGTLTVSIGGTDTDVELRQEQKTTVKGGDTSFLPKK